MKRYILNGILIFVLISIAVAVWLLSQKDSILFKPIQKYELQSEISYLKPVEIDNIMSRYLGLSFWDVDLERIQSELTRLDWASSAKVKRNWPDQLYVMIEEQKPVARWEDSGLVNQDGVVFYPKETSVFNYLVVLRGELENSGGILLALSHFQSQLNAIKFTVSELKQQLDGVWRISLSNGSEIILEGQESERKLKTFVLAYPKLSKPLRKSPQMYDLRYSNGFIVGKSVPLISPLKEQKSQADGVDLRKGITQHGA